MTVDLINKAKEKNVLVVAHRGTCGGNIPCNSVPAYQAALRAGADVIEMDVERSRDGVLFIQHPGMENVHLRMKDSIKNFPSSVVEHFRLSNWDLTSTQYFIPRLEDVLLMLRGKCIINIDKFWKNPKEISELIHQLGMEDQIIIKTDFCEDYIAAVEKYASDIPFMAIARDGIAVHEAVMKRKLRYVGLEVLFESDDAQVASKDFIERMHKDGKIIWANAIVYNYQEVLSAGHNDDISMYEDPEKRLGMACR